MLMVQDCDALLLAERHLLRTATMLSKQRTVTAVMLSATNSNNDTLQFERATATVQNTHMQAQYTHPFKAEPRHGVHVATSRAATSLPQHEHHLPCVICTRLNSTKRSSRPQQVIVGQLPRTLAVDFKSTATGTMTEPMQADPAGPSTSIPKGDPLVEKKDAPWVEKYRPKTLDDVAAHKEIIDTSKLLAMVMSGKTSCITTSPKR
jgi:hypothetical protein